MAHGSRDPRSAATISALVDRVRSLRPDLDVRLAFLDLSAPRLDTVLATVSRAVVVPLLLGRAFHADVDVPGAVSRTMANCPTLDVTVADVLGPDPRLETLALRRLAEVGVSPSDRDVGVVLAAAGSRCESANAAVTAVAHRFGQRTCWRVIPAFACAAHPTVPEAIATLHAAGARRIAVASWFLAPGLLPSKVTRLAHRADPHALLAEPLGADATVTALVADRYDAASVPRHTPTPEPRWADPVGISPAGLLSNLRMPGGSRDHAASKLPAEPLLTWRG
ncbi:MAG: sirohydrochlorin chelatase [Pseudonocardiaceae bacterium]